MAVDDRYVQLATVNADSVRLRRRHVWFMCWVLCIGLVFCLYEIAPGGVSRLLPSIKPLTQKALADQSAIDNIATFPSRHAHIKQGSILQHGRRPNTGSVLHQSGRYQPQVNWESSRYYGNQASKLSYARQEATRQIEGLRVRGELQVARSHGTDGSTANTHLVWFTGASDLRVHDHGGLLTATSDSNGAVVPAFILDPNVHLRYSPSRLALLHTALTSLERELRERYKMPLVIRRGEPSVLLPALASEIGATTCHVISDDVEEPMRKTQRAGCDALEAAGVGVRRWDGLLRSASWETAAQQLPGDFPAYLDAISSLQIQAPLGAPSEITNNMDPPDGEHILSLDALLSEAASNAPATSREALARPSASTMQPYDSLARSMGQESLARGTLRNYVQQGRDAFADALFATAVSPASNGATSLHAVAAQRLVDGDKKPSQVFALREAPTRAFAPALAVGSLSAREVRDAARESGAGTAAVRENPLWDRTSGGALADMVEWREWFTLLARRSLAMQEAGEAATTGAERRQEGDARSFGRVGYWRWGGQYLVRYLHWEAGAAYRGDTPALLFVHGFGASAEQWERLVFQLRSLASAETNTPVDELPPMYAVDLVGFGHSEKPGISYTQYVWEAQIVDFAIEVMGGVDVILCGNSIGGGLSAYAAATLGPICKGVILCNTAGVLLDPDEYDEQRAGQGQNVREETIQGTGRPYSPVVLLGQPALDLFGNAIIAFLYPQIEKRLADIYGDRPANADPALAYAIQQGASSPGSANVIGSGQKLAPNRPLNEVLSIECGFGGPVLVAQGLNDRVSGPERTRARADLFTKLRDGVTVERIEGGHCVHDDAPEAVARAVLGWLPQVRAWTSAGRQRTSA